MQTSWLSGTIFLLLISAPATGWEPDTTFFHERKKALESEYRSCTGDTASVTLDYLVQWHTTLNEWILSEAYDSARVRYMRKTRINEDDIIPCRLYDWVNRSALIRLRENQATQAAIKRYREHVEESLYVYQDMQHVHRSPIDLDSIPFGITPRTFKHLFYRHHSDSLQQDGASLIARSYSCGGYPMTAFFMFDKKSRYVRYELKGALHSPDSLDTAVRPQVDEISAAWSETLGSPDHRYRVGFFDIVQGRLSLVTVWNRNECTLYIGISTESYRYGTHVAGTGNRLLTDR